MKKYIFILIILNLLLSVLFGKQWIEEGAEGKVFLNIDKNDDEVVDCKISYDEDGSKIFQELDYNIDGMMDDFYYYEDGALVKHEVDSNYDGRIDVWVFLKEGIYITKYQQDTDYDGKIDIEKDYGI